MQKIRVAIVSNSAATDGGANSFEKAFIRQLKSSDNSRIEYVYLHPRQGFRFKNFSNSWKTGKSIEIRFNLLTKIRLAVEISEFLKYIMLEIGFRLSKLEKLLLKNRVELVVFLSPNPLALLIGRIPIITTVWDVGHLDMPDLPEFCENRSFEKREFYFNKVLPRSILTIVDSGVTAKNLKEYYKIKDNRIFVFGLLPNLEPSCDNSSKAIGRFNIEKEFIFYPAQFWSHKNHIRLIDAFAQILKSQHNLELVLTGSDKGSLHKVLSHARSVGVADSIRYLGFVTPEEYSELLRNCIGLVFPSLIGPTNLPPLEAQIFGKPMAISDFHEGTFLTKPQNCVFFDPTDTNSIKEKILEMLVLSDSEPFDFTEINTQSMNQFTSILIDLIDSRKSLGL